MIEYSHILKIWSYIFGMTMSIMWVQLQLSFGQDILWNITEASDVLDKWELHFFDLCMWFVIKVIEVIVAFVINYI